MPATMTRADYIHRARKLKAAGIVMELRRQWHEMAPEDRPAETLHAWAEGMGQDDRDRAARAAGENSPSPDSWDYVLDRLAGVYDRRSA